MAENNKKGMVGNKMTLMIHDFQKTLKEGSTLEDALKEYNLNLQTAFELCNNVNINRNIHYNEITGRYNVYRKSKKNRFEFGSYKTLEEAIQVRNLIDRYGWNHKTQQLFKKGLLK